VITPDATGLNDRKDWIERLEKTGFEKLDWRGRSVEPRQSLKNSILGGTALQALR